MSKIKSEWQTKELTTAFLEGVRGAIPGAELQLASGCAKSASMM